jgi:hypothetical protein
MSTSNNTWAGIGSSSTKSNNASADPKVASGGGGPPVIISDGSKRLLATIDMSQQSFTTMAADGDYTFNTVTGSAISTIVGKLKNRANVGTGGSVSINAGKLHFDVRSATSLYGTGYWSTSHSPILAFDLRQFSQISSDTLWQKWNVIVEADVDPLYTNGTSTTALNPANCELDIGVSIQMAAYFTSNVQPLRWAYARLRSDHASGQNPNNSDTSYQLGSDFFSNGFGATQTGLGWRLFLNDSLPFGSFYNQAPSRVGTVANSRSFYHTYSNSSFTDPTIPTYRFYSATAVGFQSTSFPGGGGGQAADWNLQAAAPGAWHTGQTNDVWATIAGVRTGGSSATAFRISKLYIYISERA